MTRSTAINDPVSLWDISSEESRMDSVPLTSEPVDLAVVGGGFTGLSTALHAAEAGLSVQLCEAETIGFGGSGRNVGLVNAGVWLPPGKVIDTLGEARGRRFLDEFGQGPARVFDLIEKHQIRCEATREGTIHAAHAPGAMAELKSRHAGWAEFGAPVSILSAGEVRERTGSPSFHGGLLDMRAGTINPMGYCRGLARAARGAGARLTSGVRVTNLERVGQVWRVTTSAGAFEARNVVLGTNAYTDSLWPGLSRMYHLMHFVQLATEPLEDRGAGILRGLQGVWTTAPIMTSVRRDAGGRLIIGTLGRDLGAVTERWAKRELRRLFPDLGTVAFEESWDGQLAMTADHLPRIVRLDEGLYTPIGYNGRGIITGTIFGASITGLLTGGDAEGLPLAVTTLEKRPALDGLRERFYALGFALNQFAKGVI